MAYGGCGGTECDAGDLVARGERVVSGQGAVHCGGGEGARAAVAIAAEREVEAGAEGEDEAGHGGEDDEGEALRGAGGAGCDEEDVLLVVVGDGEGVVGVVEVEVGHGECAW